MAGSKSLPPARPQLSQRWRTPIEDYVSGLKWSPDGKTIAASAISGPITLHDAATGKPRLSLAGHGFGTTGIAWLNTETLVSIGQDGKLRYWNTTTGEAIAAVAAGAAWVEHLACSPDGQTVATAAGKTLRTFDAQGNIRYEYPAHPSTIASLSWRPGTDTISTTCYGRIATWEMDRDAPQYFMIEATSLLNHAWSPDGRRAAIADQETGIHYWVPEQEIHLQMRGYPSKVQELAFDVSGQWLATGGGWTGIVWNCGGKGPEKSRPIELAVTNEEQRISAVAYQRRGGCLAIGCDDGTLQIWLPTQGTRPLTKAKLDGEIVQLAWSLMDTKLAVGTDQGQVILFAV